MTVSVGSHFNSGDDRGNDADIVIPNVTTPASGTFAIAVMIHQHQGTATVTGITFGATGATFAEAITDEGPSGRRDSIWRSLNAPANTTADITITMSANNRPKGADALILTSDTGNIAVVGKSAFSASNTAITGSVNPLGANHELIACCTYGAGGGSVAPTSPTVELWDLDASGPGPDSDYWTARRSTTGTGSHTIAGTISGTTGWHMVIAEVTDDPPPPNFATVANGHKIYNNGSVSDAVVIAGGSSGTPASVVEGGTYQVRVGVQNTSGSAKNFNPQLQYNHNSGGWVNCNAASTVAKVVASENVNEGTATTQRSTTGTFTAGSFEDTDGLIAAYSVPNNNVTEVVYTVYIDPAQVAASDTLEFRVDDQVSAPPSGTLHLYCSIVAATLPGVVAHAESVVSVENACSRWMWFDTNGTLYVIGEGGWNQNYDPGKPPAVIRMSTDGGLTWRVVDFKDFLATGNGDLEGLHVVNLGSGLFGFAHIETGDDVYFDEFQASDHGTPNQWVTPLSTIVQDGADSLSALMTHATAAVRQDGIVVAVYSNEPTAGGNDRLYWRRRSAGTWGPDPSPGTELVSLGGTDFTGPVLSQGLSSRVLVCYKASSGATLRMQWATNANPPVWQTAASATGGGTAAALNGPIVGIVRYDDTNDYHALVYIDTSNNLQLVTLKWNGSSYDVGTAVQINTVAVESNWPGPTETEDLDNQGANATVVADPSTGTVHLLYADATNRDLYYNTWTEGGGAGTEALEYDAPSGQGVMFVDAVIEGGKLRYVWENGVGNATPPGRGLFYNELVLSAGVNIAVGVAVETDVAQTVAVVLAVRTVALVDAVETDVAQAVAINVGNTIAVGVAVETDTAEAVAVVAGTAIVAVGETVETDVAEPVVVVTTVVVPVSEAVETDVAESVAVVVGANVVATGLAIETDVAEAVTVVAGAAIVAVGEAVETDVAETVVVTFAAMVAVGVAVEVDVAETIAVVSGVATIPVGEAVETDVAEPVVATAGTVVIPVGEAVEVDIAETVVVNVQLVVATGLAVETDVAEPVVVVAGAVTVPVDEAVEVDVAGVVGVVQGVVVVVAAAVETDVAEATVVVAGATTVAVGEAVEIDVAEPVAVAVGAVTVAVGEAVEVDVAETTVVSLATVVPVTTAVETDVAESITVTAVNVIPVGEAIETNVAESVAIVVGGGPQTVVAGVAVETDSAETVTVVSPVTVTVDVATETNVAESIALVQGVVIGVGEAIETDIAETVTAITGAVIVPVGEAVETDVAQTVTVATTVTVAVTVAVETDVAETIVLQAGNLIAVSFAIETDSAEPVLVLSGATTVAVTDAVETDLALPINLIEGALPAWWVYNPISWSKAPVSFTRRPGGF